MQSLISWKRYAQKTSGCGTVKKPYFVISKKKHDQTSINLNNRFDFLAALLKLCLRKSNGDAALTKNVLDENWQQSHILDQSVDISFIYYISYERPKS